MEATAKNHDGWRNTGRYMAPPRIDASFTEVYELIFHNKTMVSSELDVLLQLVEKKLTEKKRQVANRY